MIELMSPLLWVGWVRFFSPKWVQTTPIVAPNDAQYCAPPDYNIMIYLTDISLMEREDLRAKDAQLRASCRFLRKVSYFL